MGLDMYLHKKTYVKNWDHIKPENRHVITVTKGGKPVNGIKVERIARIKKRAERNPTIAKDAKRPSFSMRCYPVIDARIYLGQNDRKSHYST